MHEIESLQQLITVENRRIIGEALLTLVIGIATIVVVFGGVFWMSWLAFLMPLHSLVVGSTETMALIITGMFAIVSIWSAWRKHDPMSNLQPMDENLHELSIGLGYAMGVPVINRQSIAGFAALLIGGPANIMEAWSLWRSQVPNDTAARAHASQILQGSRTGFPAQMVKDGRAVSVLARLGLIKSRTEPQRGIVIWCTQKGLDALGGGTLGRR